MPALGLSGLPGDEACNFLNELVLFRGTVYFLTEVYSPIFLILGGQKIIQPTTFCFFEIVQLYATVRNQAETAKHAQIFVTQHTNFASLVFLLLLVPALHNVLFF